MSFSNNVPDRSIRVSFYDKDGTRVDNVTKEQAKIIDAASPGKLFYFQDKNGLQRELTIDQVLQLNPQNDLISDTAFSGTGCPTAPQPLGPPKVQFFGGEGVGAMANAVISPVSSGVIAFDIVDPGKNYKTPPFAVLQDEGGKGVGSSLKVITEPSGKIDNTTGKDLLKVKNVYIESPGHGYLNTFDGSLGGNGRTWKEADEGYVKTKEGKYYTVPSDIIPPDLGPEDEWNPPTEGVPTEPTGGISPPSYQVLIEFDDVVIDDPGFGYSPEDTIRITPNNGTILEPVINDRGEVVRVNIVSRGKGFDDLPEIIVDSKTGYNAIIKPILKVTRILDKEQLFQIPPGTQLVSVVDCVGKIAPKSEFDIVPR